MYGQEYISSIWTTLQNVRGQVDNDRASGRTQVPVC